jgi:O-antigen/teichoic acid export membrane protein
MLSSDEWAEASMANPRHRARWHRQASRTTQAAILSKAVAIGVRFLMIPMALRLLGPDRYGLWLTVGSLLLWIGFVGPGIGYGLINSLSDAYGRSDTLAMRRHISTGVTTIVFLGLLVLLITPLLGLTSGAARLLGVSHNPALAEDARRLLAFTGILFGLTFCLEFITPICSGLQEGYLTSIATASAAVLSLAGVAVTAWFGGSLITFAAVVGLPPILANCALSVYVLRFRYPDLSPSWKLWNTESFRTLMSFGGWMFIVQIGDLAVFQSANILIANRFGPGEVPRYAVPAAIFMSITNICYSIVQPYWPAVTEASVRRDWRWIRDAMFRTIQIRTAIIVTAGIGMVLAGPMLIRAWLGSRSVPSQELLLAMSVYFIFVVWAGNTTVLLLGLGFVRARALMALPVGFAHVAGFLWLSPVLGLAAIPVAGGFGVLLDCIVSAWIAVRYIHFQERSAAELEESLC